jgi:hypothetical protein
MKCLFETINCDYKKRGECSRGDCVWSPRGVPFITTNNTSNVGISNILTNLKTISAEIPLSCDCGKNYKLSLQITPVNEVAK